MLSKSAIDKLGNRLKDEPISEDDLRLLEEVRRLYGETEHKVFPKIIAITGLAITPRKGKTTKSIVAKLQREKTRLHTMQDLAGGRIVVENLSQQNETVRKISAIFPDAKIQDFRDSPRFGYRAVHIIITYPLPIEIQVRTESQNTWAQFSEKLSDAFGIELKYGGGPEKIIHLLMEYSTLSKRLDELALMVSALKRPAEFSEENLAECEREVRILQKDFDEAGHKYSKILAEAAS